MSVEVGDEKVDDQENPPMNEDETETNDDESVVENCVAVQTEVSTIGLGLDLVTPQQLQTCQESIKELRSELAKEKKENSDLKEMIAIKDRMSENDLRIMTKKCYIIQDCVHGNC